MNLKPILLFIATLCFVFSCSGKVASPNVEDDEAATSGEVISKPKSNYDIRARLGKDFQKRKGDGFIQVLPNFVNADGEGIYCFFLEKGNRTISLSFHIEYANYSPDLFELILDDEIIVYPANKSYTVASGVLNVVESSQFKWHTKMVNEEDETFFKKIGDIGKATLKLKKESGSEIAIIELTKKECEALRNTVEYYKASNGAKIPKKGMVNIRSY